MILGSKTQLLLPPVFRHAVATGTKSRRDHGPHRFDSSRPDAVSIPLQLAQLPHPERRGGGRVCLDERQLPARILLQHRCARPEAEHVLCARAIQTDRVVVKMKFELRGTGTSTRDIQKVLVRLPSSERTARIPDRVCTYHLYDNLQCTWASKRMSHTHTETHTHTHTHTHTLPPACM